MLSVNAGALSLQQQRALGNISSILKKSIERMSTGCKVNHAAEDPAGLAVATQIRSTNSGAKVALKNTQQAANIIDIAEMSLSTITQMAQRIQTLCLQSLSDTIGAEGKQAIQEEIALLTEEIYRQRNSANFNGLNIFGRSQEVPPDIGGGGGGSGGTTTPLDDKNFKPDTYLSGGNSAVETPATQKASKAVTPPPPTYPTFTSLNTLKATAHSGLKQTIIQS